MRRLLLILAFVALFSGCICCGGKDPSSFLSDSSEDEEEPLCEAPYIEGGVECCLDQDDSGVCDSEEGSQEDEVEETTESTETTQPETQTTQPTSTTQATSTTQTTATTIAPTTTIPAGECTYDMLLSCKENTDCGGACSGYYVFRLTSGWKEFMDTGYEFRFKDREGAEQTLKYIIEVKTPEGIKDERPISTGESFVDYLRLKAINYGEEQPKVYVRVNTEDLSTIPSQATLITVGGQSCAQSGEGMCERNYGGYKIRMANRIENGASIWITGSDGVQVKTQVTGSAKTFSPDNGLVVGGFFDPKHFIQGGYNLFYVYTV
ncbi:MAG: hypothetical protein V1744_07110 [Candidatus Altiarchaeota archaeon]